MGRGTVTGIVVLVAVMMACTGGGERRRTGAAQGNAAAAADPAACTSDDSVRALGGGLSAWYVGSNGIDSSKNAKRVLIIQAPADTTPIDSAQLDAGRILARMWRSDTLPDTLYAIPAGRRAYYWVGRCSGTLSFAYVADTVGTASRRGAVTLQDSTHPKRVKWTRKATAAVDSLGIAVGDTVSDSLYARSPDFWEARSTLAACAQCTTKWCQGS
jgi:hypothetical protein